MGHLKNECIIPVFSKDNEVTISHHSFIEAVYDAANEVFRGERVDNPDVRVSHIIKGRIPEAMDKPVNLLLDSDRAIYYERMMFCNVGDYTQRGLRCNKCKLVANKSVSYLSAHVLGKAGDFSVDGMSAEEARQKIIENIDRLPHPIRMENGVAWLHIDVLEQYGIDEKIYLFNQ